MNTFPVCTNRFTTGLRWLARLAGLGIVGLVVLFLVGTGGFNPTKLSRVESVQMFLFLVTCLGLLVAWRWELLGAGMATVAILCFFVLESIATGALPKGWVWTVMPLPGLAFLLCWFLDNGERLTSRPPVLPTPDPQAMKVETARRWPRASADLDRVQNDAQSR